jgi:hypothetical protein
MFGMTLLRETGLQHSWLTGAIASAALVRPVFDARMVCAGNEANVRELRDLLESVFEKWRNEKGSLPDGSNGGLLGNLYAGKTLDECPPYKCAGASVCDYPDLLAKLRDEQYSPLMALEAAANNFHPPIPSPLPDNVPRVPAADTKPGMQRILASLILSEAAAGNIESAAKAHGELSRIRYENERRLNDTMRTVQDKVIELAVFAAPFKKNSRKPRKPSRIRKRIAIELKKNPRLKPLQLWTILAGKPPKGFAFFDNSVGKYIEMDGRRDMGWSRFSRVCKEEKDKLIT